MGVLCLLGALGRDAHAEATPPPADPVPVVSVQRATEVLFAGHPPGQCTFADDRDQIRCLIAARYPFGPTRSTALAIYEQMGDVVGIETEGDLEGGYRGHVHIVPFLASIMDLRRMLGAQQDLDVMLAALAAQAKQPIRYRHRALVWRVFRSIKVRTPSAYALNWEIGYNHAGSLFLSDALAHDVVVHEIFHLNDAEHGNWARQALMPVFRLIVARCRNRGADCYAPYAPTSIKVAKTGMYYAFQPNNGEVIGEYAAELATRFFDEQLAAARGEAYPAGKFKCGVPENGKAWKLVSDEFFGGADLVGACAR